MALTGSFSLRDVSNEFGSSTRPSTRSLRNFYTSIFGSAGSGSRLSDFNGYGRPEILGFDVVTSNVEDGYVDIEFTLEVGNLNTFVIVEYQDYDGGATPDPVEWDFLVGNNYTSDGFKRLTHQMLSTNTTYWFRIRVYNNFNDDSTSDYVNSSAISAISSDVPQWDTPSISSAVQSGTTNVEITWDYGSSPSSFSAQYMDSNNTEWETMSNVSNTNWGTSSNPKSGIWATPLGGFGSNPMVRIRANAGSGSDPSDWSPATAVQI